MATNSLTADLHKETTWSIVLSVLIMIAGFLAIALPLTAGIAFTLIAAWMLIFVGVLHIVFAFRSGRASAAVWQVLLGIVYGFIGAYILMHPVAGLAGLTFAIAAYLFAEAVLEMVLAIQLRPAAGTGWLIFDSIITFILAVMIWSTWPSSAAWVIGVLIGISMLFSGLTRLMLTLAARRIVAPA
jgi:uncharacterized membrane protein HdeD (DUF308 family)